MLIPVWVVACLWGCVCVLTIAVTAAICATIYGFVVNF